MPSDGSGPRPPRKFISCAPAMKLLEDSIAHAARSDHPVLIIGETGTGKELVARKVHAQSRRFKNELVPVNTTALSRELVESELFGVAPGAATGVKARMGLLHKAKGGCLFLDEIGDMPVELQVKLLRVLQDRKFYRVGSTAEEEVDFRVLCATNKDLKQAIKNDTFREDLYYRIKFIEISIPPLRERIEDIPLLVAQFLSELTEPGRPTLKCSDETMQRLLRYTWPGNVRELEHVIGSASIRCQGDVIQPADLPLEVSGNVRVPTSTPPKTLPVDPYLDRIVRQPLIDEVLGKLRRDRVVALLTTYQGGGRTLARQVAAQYDGVPVLWLHNHAPQKCIAEEFFQILTRGVKELQRQGPIRSQTDLYMALEQLSTERGLLICLAGTSSGPEHLLDQVAATIRSLHADRNISFLVVGGERLLRLCTPQIYSWARLLSPHSFFDVPDLNESEVAELLRLRRLPESRAAMLHRTTGGHPGLLHELLRSNIDDEERANAEVMYQLSASHKLDRHMTDPQASEIIRRLLNGHAVANLAQRYVRHEPTRYVEARMYFDGFLQWGRNEGANTVLRCTAVQRLFEKAGLGL